jgi:hypothetical protein
VAYLRLVSHEDRGPASQGLLDVVASALSIWVPVYGGTPRGGSPTSSSRAGGSATAPRGCASATGTPPLENLAILQSDLEAGIGRLERAGVRFSDAMLEQAPRRVPRVLPS